MTRTVRELDRPGDDDLLQALLETDPGYTERVTGYPPGPSDGYSTLTIVPDGFDPAGKLVLGLFEGEGEGEGEGVGGSTGDGRLVAAAEVLHGYPARAPRTSASSSSTAGARARASGGRCTTRSCRSRAAGAT